MREEFLRPYDPASREDELYALWEKSGYFNPDVCVQKGVTPADAEPFSIVLPPPNVTGTLHMGHAAMLAVEDILVRYHRMRGKRTVWIPGTDSAAIATQSKVEGIIYKAEKKTRHDIGREELLRRIDAFTEESKSTILNQTKKMGSSLDWSRYAYTLDEIRYRAVMEAFVRLYETGLIYRGHRIVNWDPKLQTTVSDDEIEYVEQTDPYYYLQYGPFVISTVRPETKFGDKYVVMHPDDTRYAEYEHGQQIQLEWINGHITATVIKDEAADMETGTGVMTITPWHSTIDYEIAQRHNLGMEQIIDERGILLPVAGEFAGEHIKKARAKIVEKMAAKGLVVKTDEKYVHRVATNSRGGGIIEPQVKEQWFIDVDKHFTPPGKSTETTLKQWMRDVVENKEIQILPERFEKVYYHWIDNLRPWCISRQIWFGHRIPVWYCVRGVESRKKNVDSIKCAEPIVAAMPVSACPHCGGAVEQDPDTLDTWFSSGLWTFSTLGWPHFAQNATRGMTGPEHDLANFHPTEVLETGYDILFFWVARMVLMSGALLGEVPFRSVYLHGLVRDEKGRKMSKSLGNIIDPLDMIARYGADATRLSLIIGAAAGNDIKLSEQKVKGYKHFANKLWNITRFVLENAEGAQAKAVTAHSENDKEAEKALIHELDALTADVTSDIDNFRLYLAAEKLYHYTWHRFADEILEASKPILRGEDEAAKAERAATLYQMLTVQLRLLHPFMPFVTEAIWQLLPNKDAELLMVAKWPETSEK